LLCHPAAPSLVDTQLEEVVPRAQRAELAGGLGGAISSEVRRWLVGSHPLVGVLGHYVVALADPGRDRPLYTAEERLQSVRQLVLGNVKFGCDHAAADVDAYGRRDDGPFGWDDRSHSGADTDVGVGHEGDMALHDG
jgi:hypothetical protein